MHTQVEKNSFFFSWQIHKKELNKWKGRKLNKNTFLKLTPSASIENKTKQVE